MKPLHKYSLIAALFLLFLGSSAKAQDVLDGYLTEAAQNNPGLKGKFNAYLAALEKVPQVGSLPDPQISFGYFIRPVETRVGPQRAKISASQSFPWFGTLGARKDAATEMAKVKFEAFQEARSELFFNVKSTYYNLYFTQKAIGITRENIEILNIFRKLALVKVESGMASSVDVLRVEMELSDLENQLALLRDRFFAQSTDFNNLLDVDENRTIIIPDSLPVENMDYTYQAIVDSIRAGNHKVMQLDFAMNAYNKQELAARKTGAPKIKIGADYIITGKSSNPSLDQAESGKDAIVFPMVGITIPIYRKKYNAMVREASLMYESAANEKADRINKLESVYANANNDYQDAARRITLFRLQSDRAQKALSMLRTAYESSGQNFEEVLRMERQLLKFKLEYAKAKADKHAAIAYINRLMGK